MLRRIALIAVAVVVGVQFLVPPQTASAVTAADWRAGQIIDDPIFTDVSSMSVNGIQDFLNSLVPSCDIAGTQPASDWGRPDLTHAQYAASRGWPAPPYVCLKNYYEVPKTQPGPGVPANSFTNGGNPPAGSVNAAQMIYNAAAQYNISPKVLLVKLDTESAGPLTRDTWPLQKQYTYAMGAHCPDSGPGGSANCDSTYAGFSIQIAEAAKLLRYYLDNMEQSWWPYKRPYQNNSILWNVAPTGCGASNVFIQTKATAALYTYTPYQPNQAALNNMYGTGDGCSAYGNRNFWRVFYDWFGAPYTGICYSTYSVVNTDVIVNAQRKKEPKVSFMIYSGASTNCVEFHTWNSSLTGYASHTASSSASIDPANSMIAYADLSGTGMRVPVLVGLRGTGSGMIEFHVWNGSLQTWASHTISNMPCIDPSLSVVRFADLNGDGKDEGVLIGQGNGSTSTGRIEFHIWNQGLQSWNNHVVSNSSTLDPRYSKILFGNFNGEGKDTAALVGMHSPHGTGSGNIEFHIWDNNLSTWNRHTVSNQVATPVN
ncbi:MAG: hypothetical protein WAW63_04255 [Candidatus Saccharimonadales bacterium]